MSLQNIAGRMDRIGGLIADAIAWHQVDSAKSAMYLNEATAQIKDLVTEAVRAGFMRSSLICLQRATEKRAIASTAKSPDRRYNAKLQALQCSELARSIRDASKARADRGESMSASFCWWCSGRLVGPGGVPGREPLFYRTVKTMDDGREVRVHAGCEQDTKDFFTVVTANPPSTSIRTREGS